FVMSRVLYTGHNVVQTEKFSLCLLFFFFNDPATTDIYTLSLHDALPIFDVHDAGGAQALDIAKSDGASVQAADGARFLIDERLRSEEHTSELQSRSDLVCRLLLEKKKTKASTCVRQTTPPSHTLISRSLP